MVDRILPIAAATNRSEAMVAIGAVLLTVALGALVLWAIADILRQAHQ